MKVKIETTYEYKVAASSILRNAVYFLGEN